MTATAKTKTTAFRVRPPQAASGSDPDGAGRNPPLHLKKLCVGVADASEFFQWMQQRERAFRGQRPEELPWIEHVTRQWPRRAEEIIAGGSLYWVVAGAIIARQPLLALREVVADGRPACAIRLALPAIATESWPHRPFQGWRYLEQASAPPDLCSLPPEKSVADSARQSPELLSELISLGIIAR